MIVNPASVLVLLVQFLDNGIRGPWQGHDVNLGYEGHIGAILGTAGRVVPVLEAYMLVLVPRGWRIWGEIEVGREHEDVGQEAVEQLVGNLERLLRDEDEPVREPHQGATQATRSPGCQPRGGVHQVDYATAGFTGEQHQKLLQVGRASLVLGLGAAQGCPELLGLLQGELRVCGQLELSRRKRFSEI